MSGGGVGGGGVGGPIIGGGGSSAGHRRIASIRSNARNLFKSNKSSHSDLSSRARYAGGVENGSGNNLSSITSSVSGNNKAAVSHIQMAVNQIVSNHPAIQTEPPILEEGVTHASGDGRGDGYISPSPPPPGSGSRISPQPPPTSSGSHQQSLRRGDNVYGNSGLYHSHSLSAFEVGTSIHSRSTHRRPSQVSETVFGEPIMTHHHFGHHGIGGRGGERGDSGSVRSKTSDLDAVLSGSERDGASPTSPSGHGPTQQGGKQKKHGSGNKIRMALGLLRRRSGSNLKKQQAVEPIGEERETVEWQPQFRQEPLLDPDSVEPTDRSYMLPKKQRSDSFSQPAASKSISQQHNINHGFKFGIPSRQSTRHVLQKPAPNIENHHRPRRATVASVVLESQTTPGTSNFWSEIDRPRSSHSSTRPNGILPEPSSDSIFSRESAAFAMGGGSPDGGLFPRPASLRRDFSEGGFSKRESITKTPGLVPPPVSSRTIPLTQAARLSKIEQRARPVSFGGVPSSGFSYASALSATPSSSAPMKITEAASLELRVKDLEAQITQLQNNFSGPVPPSSQQREDWPLRRSLDLISKPINGLGLSTAPTSSSTSPSTSSPFLPNTQPSFTLTPSIPTTPATAAQELAHHLLNSESESESADGSFHLASHPDPDRASALLSLEGRTLDKRATVSTIRPPSQPPIQQTDFQSLLTLLAAEAAARQRLEQRVDHLTTLLQTHGLLPGSNPTSRPTSSLKTPHHVPLRSSKSDTVPTPDLTPPPSSPAHVLLHGHPDEGEVDDTSNYGDHEGVGPGDVTPPRPGTAKRRSGMAPMHSGTFSAINGGTFFRGFDGGRGSGGFEDTDDEEIFEPGSSLMAGKREEEMWGDEEGGLELGVMRSGGMGGGREWDESPTLGVDGGEGRGGVGLGRTLSLGEVTRRGKGAVAV